MTTASHASRTSTLDDHATPDGTHRTTVHRCADGGVQPHTCHTPEFVGGPSGDDERADNCCRPERASGTAVRQHSGATSATHHGGRSGGDGDGVCHHNVADLGHNVTDLQFAEGLCGHELIQPQTGGGVNHKRLTVGSLFSGIGGIDLGLERAGMTVIWQSEIDPYASRVLAKHWPNTPNLGDITKIKWSEVERVDVICGGYPCQPFSYAGARAGTNDRRHLWPYFLNAIRYLRPRFALLENVPGHLSLGFGRVLGDLAESGFDAEWDCIPAAAVGAPHRRDRVFVVAHANGQGEPGRAVDGEAQGLVVQDANGERLEGTELQRQFKCFSERPRHSSWWTVEPSLGRVADGVPDRMGQLHALGNAVVPQVAEHVGRMIVQAAT